MCFWYEQFLSWLIDMATEGAKAECATYTNLQQQMLELLHLIEQMRKFQLLTAD